MVSQKEAIIRAILRKAREVKDPLKELVTAFRQCDTNSNGLVQFRCYHARDMPKELQDWCLAVCRENMAELYERVWSWSDTQKRKQLTSIASRFLIAHDAAPGRTPLAYVNYRFEQEEGEPVLYCYELQVVRQAQSRGLGRSLMDLTERIAWAAGMQKVMLTVFCDNTTAVSFYRKLGYRLDETSPDYCGEEEGGGEGKGGGGAGGAPAASGTPGDGGGGGGGGLGGSGNSNSSGGDSQASSACGGAGYHIMSKRAPPPEQQQGKHPQQQQQEQQQQQRRQQGQEQQVGKELQQQGQGQGQERQQAQEQRSQVQPRQQQLQQPEYQGPRDQRQGQRGEQQQQDQQQQQGPQQQDQQQQQGPQQQNQQQQPKLALAGGPAPQQRRPDLQPPSPLPQPPRGELHLASAKRQRTDAGEQSCGQVLPREQAGERSAQLRPAPLGLGEWDAAGLQL